MIESKVLLDYDDLVIIPEPTSQVDSRKQVNPYDEHGFLPLFTAPMSTVVNQKNAEVFYTNRIKVVLPRTEEDKSVTSSILKWKSFGLDDFKETFLDSPLICKDPTYVLLDVANGHMAQIKTIIRDVKLRNPMVTIMVGNVANPQTYLQLTSAGADYVRIGIGGGCFIDGTIVSTSTGLKKIEEINIGDLVLTHKGNYREVLSKKRIEYDGDVVIINDDITCTPDHLFYVLPKKYEEIVTEENIENLCEWVSAKELLINPDYLLVEPIINEN